jgi:hypothetical protein
MPTVFHTAVAREGKAYCSINVDKTYKLLVILHLLFLPGGKA